jgi:mannose-6-phosphate isomerase-like protein (cupin superfamily)
VEKDSDGMDNLSAYFGNETINESINKKKRKSLAPVLLPSVLEKVKSPFETDNAAEKKKKTKTDENDDTMMMMMMNNDDYAQNDDGMSLNSTRTGKSNNNNNNNNNSNSNKFTKLSNPIFDDDNAEIIKDDTIELSKTVKRISISDLVAQKKMKKAETAAQAPVTAELDVQYLVHPHVKERVELQKQEPSLPPMDPQAELRRQQIRKEKKKKQALKEKPVIGVMGTADDDFDDIDPPPAEVNDNADFDVDEDNNRDIIIRRKKSNINNNNNNSNGNSNGNVMASKSRNSFTRARNGHQIPVLSPGGVHVTTTATVAIGRNQLEYRSLREMETSTKRKMMMPDDVKVAYALDDGDSVRSGMLVLLPSSSKPLAASRGEPHVFFVHSGNVSVTMHGTLMELSRGSFFMVPPGNSYAIANDSTQSEAQLVFFSPNPSNHPDAI